MDGITCDFCGNTIDSLDFYLSIKGGNICPDCLRLGRWKIDSPAAASPRGSRPGHADAFPMRGEALFSPRTDHVLF